MSEEDISEYAPGQEIKLSELGFAAGDFVDVRGTSIGKGYAGVMKRHGFHGFKKTHGAHEYQRHGGSIGTSATPSRVLKGKKMAGQLGNQRVTVQNLTIAEVRAEENLLLIRGAVPETHLGLGILDYLAAGVAEDPTDRSYSLEQADLHFAAIKLGDPGYPEAIYNRAVVALARDDEDEARRLLSVYAELRPGSPWIAELQRMIEPEPPDAT